MRHHPSAGRLLLVLVLAIALVLVFVLLLLYLVKKGMLENKNEIDTVKRENKRRRKRNHRKVQTTNLHTQTTPGSVS